MRRLQPPLARTIIVLARPSVKQIYGRGWETPEVKSVATAMT
jgi:hypothetical protein